MIGRVMFGLAVFPGLLAAQEPVDTQAVMRLRQAGTSSSQVMALARDLTTIIGPRLTHSAAAQRAGEYAVAKLKSFGVASARLEAWGPFGWGWSNQKTIVSIVSPRHHPLIAFPTAWTPGTSGPLRARIAIAVADSSTALGAFHGKVRGKVLLLDPPVEVTQSLVSARTRLSDSVLSAMDAAPPNHRPAGPTQVYREWEAALEKQRQRALFFAKEGAVALVRAGTGGYGTVYAVSGGSWHPETPWPILQLTIAAEQYNDLYTLSRAAAPVVLDLDVRSRFDSRSLGSFNVIAEIPGTDPALRSEVVMLGAHLDSEPNGTGATDNAAGCAVALEAMRLLTTLHLPLRRTVRVALWTGEEQGLLGSEAYVRAHFGDEVARVVLPDQRLLSAYFNLDNGSGAIRGVYAEGNLQAIPIFRAWLGPFRDWGARTVTALFTEGTDHERFDAVGIPGFQFIQDGLDYDFVAHTNMDVFDRLDPLAMQRNAVIMASVVLHAANREEMLPRKPLWER